MTKKKFANIREGDTIYWISMKDSELNETSGTCLKELEVSGIIRSTNVFMLSIRTKGGTFFTTSSEKTVHVQLNNEQDEINLSFDVYATTKEEAVDKALEEINRKENLLGLIKKRLNESETGLLLANTTLSTIDTEEEPSLEEFAAMALS